MSHSRALYMLGMKFDFQGVLVLMWSATVPLIYYTFPCDGRLRLFYMGLFTVLAAACSAVTFLPRFSGPHLGPYRAVLFGSFGGGSFALPIFHGLLQKGLGDLWERVGLGWILATVACNGIGVAVYGVKVSQIALYIFKENPRLHFANILVQFPEKWFPRRFDLLGASHQLMHICVVAAALTYTCAVVQAFDYRHEQGAACELLL